jgi:membrane protein YqaA with SNARE-associated domain
MASTYELLGVLFTSFGINLIPFASPSNLFIASSAALMVNSDPFTLGFLVALGSALAKGTHYVVTFFVSKHLGEKRRQRLDAEALKVKRWAFLLLFAAAATPIPDEPIVIPLGLLRYNPAKFFTAFFFGKLSITIIGAYLGNLSESFLSSVISQQVLAVISIILTVVITVILLKVDLGKIVEKILKRKIVLPQQTGNQH